MRPFRPLLAVLFACVALAGPTRGESPRLTSADADGIVPLGQSVEWALDLPTPATQPVSLPYEVKLFGAQVIDQGAIELSPDRPAQKIATRATTQPSTLLLEVDVPRADESPARLRAGAVIAPERIAPAADAPAEFDAFWNEQLARSNALPLNPQVTPGNSGRDGVTYEFVTLDNVDEVKIRGQLARPDRQGRFPAMLIVQWAGVYPLQKAWVTDRAAEGWLALNISAHDQPIDESDAYFKQLTETELKNYTMIGAASPQTSYFLPMYLATHRAVEYLAQRPEWDGKTIIVTGSSQGGLLAIITAALQPEKVTALMAKVPAGCDTLAYTAGRSTGWPYWWGNARGKPDEAAIMNTSRYFDAANFAPRVRCPALVSVGLVDLTCPPAGVIGMTNRLGGPVELLILPDADHKGTGGTHAPHDRRAGQWSRALLTGNPPPVQPHRPADNATNANMDAVAPPAVFSWDPKLLVEGRRLARSDDPSVRAAVERLRKSADALLDEPDVSVTDKDVAHAAPTGDVRDYTSLSVYYWPDEKDPAAPWIRIDGNRNDAGVSLFDSPRLFKMCERVTTFAQAWWFTGDQRYARAAAGQLRRWFVDEQTRMNPNMEYAQFVPNLNKGTQWGIIDANRFHEVYNAVGLIAGSGEWSDQDQQTMRRWVLDFNRWLTTSENGVAEGNTHNNHAVYYDMLVAGGALFAGDGETARRVLADVPSRRYASQIEPDGSMPHELARVNAASYVGMNLMGFIHLAIMGEQAGVDLWHASAGDGRNLRNAIEWTMSYVDGTETWTAGDGKFGPGGFLAIYWHAARAYPDDPRFKAMLETKILPSLAPQRRETTMLRLLVPRG